MSDQPTEKHEFLAGEHYPSICRFETNTRFEKQICGQSRSADVHQPSAVQAPERIAVQEWGDAMLAARATIPLELWHQLFSKGNIACGRLLRAYEAQAVRIAELEDALTGVAIMLNTELRQYESEPWARRVRAALKPKSETK